MMRTFLSLKLDSAAKEKIKQLQYAVKEITGLQNSRKIKWENTDNSHITLFFLGDTEEKTAEKICCDLRKKIENKTGEINLAYSGVGAFPNLRTPRVIIAKLDAGDGRIFSLSASVTEILDAYGFKQDKPLKPHLTLGRVRREESVPLPDFRNIRFNLILNFKELIFNKSVLSSKGVEHFLIDRFKL